MKIFKYFSYLLLLQSWMIFSPLFLFSESMEDPILVQIQSENSISPLYLSSIQDSEKGASDSYKKQIQEIILFDLDCNGYTYVMIPNAVELAAQIKEAKNKGSSFFVQPLIKKDAQGLLGLGAHLWDFSKEKEMSIDPVLITQEIQKDRHQIHQLSNAILKAFFGEDGIATTRLIYTLRTRNSNNSREWNSEIWEMDYDGGNPHRLVTGHRFCVNPTYIPPKAGNATGGCLFVSYELGQPKLYVASLKDGKAHRVSSLRGNQLMPTVSLQRDRIAFISDITGNPDLFILPFTPEKGPIGKPQQIFHARQATQGSPSFSPDGKQVAFVSDKDGSPRIYIIDIPPPDVGSKKQLAQLISRQNKENSAPSWAPDGKKIAYCARSTGDRQIWLSDLTSKRETQLTHSKGNKENPSWAPNSLHLVYNSVEGETAQLFILNLHQSKPIQISKGIGEKRFPNWEPRIR